LDSALVIGVREGNFYRLHDNHVQDLVHNIENLCDLWYRRLGHLHYMEFPILREIVTSIPYFSIEQQGVCKGCALGKNVKATFPSSKIRSRGILNLIHSHVGGLMSVTSL